jgi:PAS domain S-box-containing protein
VQDLEYALPLFFAAGALVLLAQYAWRHRKAHPAAAAFVWLMVPLVGWLAGYGFEILGRGLAPKETWETVIIVSLAWMPLFWLIFAVQYSGQEAWLTRRNVALLALPPIVTTLLTLTNSAHGLMWVELRLDSSGPFLATVPVRGAWFLVHSLIGYSYVLFGSAMFITFVARSEAIFRWQGLIVVFSCLIPLLGNALHLLGAVPVPGFDPGAFAFALSAGLIALAMFRYQFLDVVPIAQRVVLDHLTEGVIVLDPHDRILYVNPAARQMLHLTSGELAGRLARALIQPPEILTLAAAPGQEPERLPIATGDVQRWHEVLSLPMTTSGGRLAGRIMVVRDVTEARAVEMLREDLARIVVHDLRNPLNVVSASLEVLQDSLPADCDRRVLSSLRLARQGCSRAVDLVNSILELARLESGKMPLNRQPVRPAWLIAEVAEVSRLLAQESQLLLEVEAPDDLPLVWADESLLRRVLENLIHNALKFTPPGGGVSIAARRLDDTLLVEVSDTGRGIPEEQQHRLFQRFSAGPGPKQGSGLGLAFCKLAVEAHGGRIWIASSSPQGTRVQFTIPLARDQGDGPRADS